MTHVIKHLVLPDCQVRPGVPTDHLEWLGQYIMDKKPDVVVQLGDFADMASLSSYDKGKCSYEGRRYKNDIKAALDGMNKLLGPLKEYQERCKGKIRYNPRLILTLGNHEDRITRAIEDDPKLEGTVSLDNLQYAAFGWEVHPFLKPVTVDGVIYSHYLPSGQMGRPCTSAKKILSLYHQSCVVGHQQGRDIAYGRRANGKAITAIIAGSCYLHDESYLNPVTNNVWKGFYMLHEVDDGSFDEMSVSLNYLKRKYS